MINKTRLIDEFIELVSVPCPSKDEKQEAELIMAKLRELGLEPEMDKAHEKTGGTCGNVWAYVKGTVPNAPKLLFEAHMDSVAPTTGTKVVRKDGVLYSDGTTTLGGDDKVGVAAMLEAVRALKEDGVAHGDVQLIAAGHLHRPLVGSLGGAPVMVAPSSSHQIDLNLLPGAPLACRLEPPVVGLYRHTPGEGIACHFSYVDQFSGPFPI